MAFLKSGDVLFRGAVGLAAVGPFCCGVAALAAVDFFRCGIALAGNI
jgi:hypothetical protein